MRAQSPYPSRPLSAPPPLDLRDHALFLDLDGTLLDIAPRPDSVSASGALLQLLRELNAAMHGAVAVITGRTLNDAARILHGAVPHLAGVHGHEMRYGGEIAPNAAEFASIAAAARDLQDLEQRRAMPALVENKRASLALHYRHAPHAEADVQRIAQEIAAAHNLRVLRGKMVVELLAGERTKGDALKRFMAAPPFAGRVPVKLGDDVTDEEAFRAAYAGGGFGVLVGAPRESAASYILADPAAVHAWLRAAIAEHAS